MSNLIKQFGDLDINEATNVAQLVGTLSATPVYSHTYDDVLYYSARLKVNRSNGTKHDNIHVFIPKSSLVIDSKILDAGVRIQVKGKLVQSELREMSDVSVVADEVTLAAEDAKDENQIYIGGTIHRLFELRAIKDSKRVVKQMILKHTVSTEKGARNLTVKVSCWNNTGRLVDDKYAEGDKILIRGQLESKVVKSKQADSNNRRSTVMLHEATAAVIIDLAND